MHQRPTCFCAKVSGDRGVHADHQTYPVWARCRRRPRCFYRAGPWRRTLFRRSPKARSTGAESLKQYRIPEWFRDAKFGIWAHWGPQSAVEDGDWYARNMYIAGQPAVQVPRRDLRPSVQGRLQGRRPSLGKAREFDPDHLMTLYKKAGAKYFMSHGRAPRQLRPVELQAPAALERRGHRAEEGHRRAIGRRRAQARPAVRASASISRTATTGWRSRTARDKTGPLAGVPYDGTDPAYADLYHAVPEGPADSRRRP